MESFLVPYVSLCGVTLIIGWFLHWVYKWVNPPCKGKLPPGSMGFPIIGETFQFLKTSRSIDIPSCYQQRLSRYGPVFKTNLLGKPLVVSMDPELDRFIFQQEGKLFRLWLPEAGNNIFGKKTVTMHSDATHRLIRSIASKLFGPENLKEVLIRELEDVMRMSMAAWAAKPSIDVKDSVADMIFDLIAKKMINMDSNQSRELRKNFDDFSKGIFSFPIYFPGTLFYKCMKGRRNIHRKLTEMLKDRLSTPGRKHGDLLDVLVEELRSEKPLIDESLATDLLAVFLLASMETTSSTLSIALKFLTDNPKVVETLKEEHETIMEKREDNNSGFTWAEYKSLTFTTQVMNEVNRISNIAPGIFRKALTDVQVNGYTIPAGWLVMISPMAVHLNPTLFEDPLKFNPWRWMITDEAKRITQMRNFMPFGGGIRFCLGADFAKLVISLFLHVLVTNYRWIPVKGGEIVRFGEIAMIPLGYHIQLVPTTK
ncbi:hypothetical protein ACP70R_004127 [Stipagrostis hirtigluma subsp. patula]